VIVECKLSLGEVLIAVILEVRPVEFKKEILEELKHELANS